MTASRLHLRSDVPVGAYVSGGIDSSLIAILAAKTDRQNRLGVSRPFHRVSRLRRVADTPQLAAGQGRRRAAHLSTSPRLTFATHISDVIWHLDSRSPGRARSRNTWCRSSPAEHVKVVLGGQGGDEIFGGYARYLIAYFEQCIKAAIDGTYQNGNYVVTIESIVPNLGLLREYKPMMQRVLARRAVRRTRRPLFPAHRPLDRHGRRGRMVASSTRTRVFDAFRDDIQQSATTSSKEAYFDKMTHFDFKCLLPALLAGRGSHEHGAWPRKPRAAARPSARRIRRDGPRRRQVRRRATPSICSSAAFGHELPDAMLNRRDKMGFPVPLKEWFGKSCANLCRICFARRRRARGPYFNAQAVLANLDKGRPFSRKTWGLISLEIWHQLFHDRGCANPGRPSAGWPAGKAGP